MLASLIPTDRADHILSSNNPLLLSQIETFLSSEYDAGTTIYPARDDIFKALELTPWDRLKVVMLGQDPYHGDGQAMGLSFSVPDGMKLPPSLRNIYKELELEQIPPNLPFLREEKQKGRKISGDLTSRAEQGILLLNSILTVRAGEPASHSKIGRQIFTDEIIRQISMKQSGIVFMLRGNYAISKDLLIDKTRHLILKAVHPSPLSASRGRFGCNHFRLCNEYLISQGKSPIQR